MHPARSRTEVCKFRPKCGAGTTYTYIENIRSIFFTRSRSLAFLQIVKYLNREKVSKANRMVPVKIENDVKGELGNRD